MISFTSSVHSLNNEFRRQNAEEMDIKMDTVDSLVPLLGGNDIEKMSITFLALSSTPTNCDMMRHHRVVPFLVKILHSNDRLQTTKDIRKRVGRALHNIVHAHPEQKQCKREAKILRLLEVLRMYSDFLRDVQESGEACATLSKRGCGPLRLGVALGQNQQEILICSKFPLIFRFRFGFLSPKC